MKQVFKRFYKSSTKIKSIDEPVGNYIPEFKEGKKANILNKYKVITNNIYKKLVKKFKTIDKNNNKDLKHSRLRGKEMLKFNREKNKTNKIIKS